MFNSFLSKISKKLLLAIVAGVLVISIGIIFTVFYFTSRTGKITAEQTDMFKEAKKLYLENKLENTISLLETLTAKNSHFVNAQFMLGKAYFFNDNIKKAKAIWEKILKKYPQHIDTLNWLGLLYSYNKETQAKAIDLFNQVLENDSLNLTANYNLGKLYFNMQDYQKAIYYFSNALENENHLTDLHLEYAKLYKKLDLKDKALLELSKAKRLTSSEVLLKEAEELEKSLK